MKIYPWVHYVIVGCLLGVILLTSCFITSSRETIASDIIFKGATATFWDLPGCTCFFSG